MPKTVRQSLLILLLLATAVSCRHDKVKNNNDPEASAKKIRQKYAAILGVSESKLENMKLYTFIDEWYSTPYKYGGKTKDGIDCSGFASVLMKTVYGKTVTPPCSKIFEQCETLKEKALEEGNLVFFKIEGNKVSHVGIYLVNNKFVHASTSKGVIISSLEENYYTKYFYKGGRLK